MTVAYTTPMARHKRQLNNLLTQVPHAGTRREVEYSSGGMIPPESMWDRVNVVMRHAWRVTCEPAWHVTPLKIHYDKLFYVAGGKGWVQYNDRRIDVRRGMLTFSRAGDVVAYGHDAKHPLTFYSAGFNLRTIQYTDALASLALPYAIRLTAARQRQLCEQFDAVIARFRHDDPPGALAFRGSFLCLLATALQWAQTLPEQCIISRAESRTSGTYGRMAAVQAYIHQHLAEPLSTVELAKRFNLSPAHFGNLFRRFSGQTPIAYIQDRRIEAAKIILASSDAPISDVARSVGYDDALYFSRVFKRMEHISPKKYRTSCNNPLIA